MKLDSKIIIGLLSSVLVMQILTFFCGLPSNPSPLEENVLIQDTVNGIIDHANGYRDQVKAKRELIRIGAAEDTPDVRREIETMEKQEAEVLADIKPLNPIKERVARQLFKRSLQYNK